MKRIVLIMGDLASGKTEYSVKLSNQLNIPVFNKDTFKEVLSDAIGFQNRTENMKISDGAYRSMFYVASCLMQKSISFIMESNFRQHEIDSFYQLIQEYKYESITLILQGDMKIMHDRYIARLNIGRHDTHKSLDLSNFEDFKQFNFELRKVKPKGKYKIVNANDFSYQNDEILLDIIKNYN